MDKTTSINKLESIFNKMLCESQSQYEQWLVSAASQRTDAATQDDHNEDPWVRASHAAIGRPEDPETQQI
ncbi:MAG TPA: hypothetical protein VGN60_09710 [Devosia sp.]|jgi:phenylalanyl-tRNA synthetase beta subunit|nr:hypothetical protein [Devosia sp.]